VWTHVVDRSPQATFFHSPAWADVVRSHGLGEPQTLLASWPDGRQAICVIGVRPAWRGLIRAARTGTAGGYGGLVATGPLTVLDQRRIYRALWQRFGECGGSSNPFAEPPPPDTGFTLQQAPPTLAIRLAPLPELRRRYHQDRQQAVARYQAAGVSLRHVEQPCPDDWQAFLRLYELETAFWHAQGRPLHLVRDAGWFASLQHHAARALRMVVATVDGVPAGILVYACQQRIATELYLVWDRQFRKAQVTTALKEACLAACHARGLQWLDFMPSGSLDGVARFKTSFGAEPLPIWEFAHPSWAARGLRLLKPPRTADPIAS
jgi:hypothetical protein